MFFVCLENNSICSTQFVYKRIQFVQLADVWLSIQHSSKYLFGFLIICLNFVLTGGVVIFEGIYVSSCLCNFFLWCCFAGLNDIIIIVFHNEFFICWNKWWQFVIIKLPFSFKTLYVWGQSFGAITDPFLSHVFSLLVLILPASPGFKVDTWFWFLVQLLYWWRRRLWFSRG